MAIKKEQVKAAETSSIPSPQLRPTSEVSTDRMVWQLRSIVWQPIETAPINESVLVYIPNAEHYGEGIYRAIWIESSWLMNGKKPRHWQTTGWHHGRDVCGDTQPTHWMPLPEPPESQTEVARDSTR